MQYLAHANRADCGQGLYRLSRAVRLGLFLLALDSSPGRALSPAPEAGGCSLETASPATVAGVDDDFALLLDDGRRAALSGLEFPGKEFADLHEAARRRLSAWLTGRDIFFGAFAAPSDRWGRVAGHIFAASDPAKDAPLVSVGAALLEEGLARFRPDPAAASCAMDYRAAEARGRKAGAGLWTLPVFKVVDAGNRAELLQRKGMVVVEGEIRSVGQSSRAIYLNFDNKKLEGFAIVISRRNLAMFAQAGIDTTRLVGRRARVRGLIETSYGPRIEISSPAAIELIDDPAR